MTNDSPDVAQGHSGAEPTPPRRTMDPRQLRTLLSIALVILAFLLAGVGYLLVTILRPIGGPTAEDDSAADGLIWIRSIYGWGDDASNQLVRPNDTAIGPDGTIWVTDGRNDRVLGFSPSGELRQILHFGPRGSSPRSFNLPYAIDVDEVGNVYVANLGGDNVTVVSPENRFIRRFRVPAPLEVAVARDRIVVGSAAGLGIHDRQGREIRVLGIRGKGEKDFDGPRGIVVADDGTIYVTEMHNKRLKAYDRDGNLKYVSTLEGKPAGAQAATRAVDVQLPAGMTMDGRGRLVYVDPFAFTINVVDPADGRVIASYGQHGERDGRFFYPTGISYDPARDWFAVADTNNDRVQIVRIPGSGAAPVATALRRAAASPLTICCFPLILLLLAAIVLVVARRRRSRSFDDTGWRRPEPCDDGHDLGESGEGSSVRP